MSESQSSESLMPDENAGNRGVIEALLIASDEPLGAAKLASVLNGVDARQVRAYVDELNEEYGNTGRSFKITEVAGGYQLMVHPEYAAWIRRLLREKSPARLSPASLETLAIIAFKQPLIKAEVEHIRGVAV
ncbi:MAG: SMC-Scp complex subunit ScpB, partial [bacterium]|nr:SMC-Scp complex subunit ScpB [bacterium]